MNCKNCNNELNDSTKFCAKCGQKVNEEIKSEEIKSTSEQKTDKKSTLTSIVSVVVFILAIGVGKYLIQGDSSTGNNSQSKVEIINQAVKEAKLSITLPSQLDSATTLTDITAETNAIRYHYILANIDTSSVSNESLKSYLKTSICGTEATKNLLNRDINMEYSYTVENIAQSYFISFNKADCL